MNVKRFVLACIAVYALNQILSILIHQVWLAETYASLAQVWRPEKEMMSLLWMMWINSAVYTVLFCYIFVRGYENKGILEGVRYGAIIGVFISVPMAFDSYVIYPVPFSLALKWFLSGIVVSILGGIVLALIYRPKRAGPA